MTVDTIDAPSITDTRSACEQSQERRMTADTIEILVWAFNAFWLWLLLAALLRRVGLPLPQASAALLGWVCAGALLPWTLPVAEQWLDHFPSMFHWLINSL